jgi:hypothetical protein
LGQQTYKKVRISDGVGEGTNIWMAIASSKENNNSDIDRKNYPGGWHIKLPLHDFFHPFQSQPC